jgi:hypothetical protein
MDVRERVCHRNIVDELCEHAVAAPVDDLDGATNRQAALARRAARAPRKDRALVRDIGIDRRAAQDSLAFDDEVIAHHFDAGPRRRPEKRRAGVGGRGPAQLRAVLQNDVRVRRRGDAAGELVEEAAASANSDGKFAGAFVEELLERCRVVRL